MKLLISFFAILISIILTGCQSNIFGVKKEVWESLNKEQQQQVISDFHKLESEKQRHAAEIRALELENEAKLSPYVILRDAIAKSKNDQQPTKEKA